MSKIDEDFVCPLGLYEIWIDGEPVHSHDDPEMLRVKGYESIAFGEGTNVHLVPDDDTSLGTILEAALCAKEGMVLFGLADISVSFSIISFKPPRLVSGKPVAGLIKAKLDPPTPFRLF